MQEIIETIGETMLERILCAAIWLNDGIVYIHQPINIEIGIVVSGRRHHNCFITLFKLRGEQGYDKTKIEQGFITSLDRYVDRAEAYIIAKKANQLLLPPTDIPPLILMSEDLY
jgi:hypothetical protein